MKDIKRVVLRYGENTISRSYRIPKSKFDQIDKEFREILSKHEDLKIVEVNIAKKKSLSTKGNNKSVEKPAHSPAEDYEATSEISNSEGLDLSKANEPISIKEMPRDKKPYSLIKGDYDGLYSSKGKWYTNKVVSNAIVIFEWTNLDSAKNYLDSLKK